MNLDAPASISSDVFADYQRPGQVFDEMKNAQGEVRSRWQPLLRHAAALNAEGLRERRENARQLLREHGVTYNVHTDGESAARTWELDVLPLVISSGEWAHIEAGLIQRARLLNAVLADIYGPQRLLRDGLLPPALLHANPGFLRPCHGVLPPSGHFLTLQAIDLIRAPSGQWWVLTDRTQAPSGLGYALENRIIISRILPDAFRDCGVQRLATFFTKRKAGLRALAPWSNSPHIVLLTPGPFSETYFEHAYLARYLGYPLVEGNDLTVRDRRVFLKTLEGLQPVDVIIRRVDDTFCDPLELRSDSVLGVPGLLEAARAGNVAISNPLGSGAVEAPALLAFLPALAQRLLGEELLIPNVATWWCGQDKERSYALGTLDSLVIKRGFVGTAINPVFGETQDAEALDQLAARIRANPHIYVGQERVALSTAPVWNGHTLEPRPLTLRCFVCATADGYAVLPGGLTRVSTAASSPVVSSRFGGGSKDTWVLSDGPVEPMTLLDSNAPIAPSERIAAQVPSRSVENLFWLGRYAERLEDTTRLLRTALGRLSGEGSTTEEAELAAIARWLVAREKLPPRFAKRVPFSDLTEALHDLVFAADRPGNVRDLLRRIHYLTSSVRDRLSGDTWRILNQLQTDFPQRSGSNPATVTGTLHRVIFQLAAFSGMELENMTRGHAWRFLDLGRRLERAANVLTNLRAALTAEPLGGVALVPLLECTDSTMTYRRRYLALPDLPRTLDLLLADSSNPRALAFQIEILNSHIVKLPGSHADLPERRRAAELVSMLANVDFISLGGEVLAGNAQPLNAWLNEFLQGCWNLSDLLTAQHFSHVLARAN